MLHQMPLFSICLWYVSTGTLFLSFLLYFTNLRYLSVNYPIKYRNKRKLIHVKIAMALTWIISAILWAPWVFIWQFIKGKRTVPKNDCYIQFIYDSTTMAYVTSLGFLFNLEDFCWETNLAAFYVPVFAMCLLYSRVYISIDKRRK